MSRAQGLPISFIVLAAMSLLVLVVMAMFFIGGFRTDTVDSQSAANTCNNYCLTEIRKATNMKVADYTTTIESASSYCKYNSTIKGMGSGIKCTTLSPCKLTFTDGSKSLSCP